MKRYSWPMNDSGEVVSLVPRAHPAIVHFTSQILEHGRMGQRAFHVGRLMDAKFHRDCCAQLLWRLGVDGLTRAGQICWDGAKYETRLPGRLSSLAAREIRELPEFRTRSHRALAKRVACEHIVPRNCVAEVLVRPDWWDPEDTEGGARFVLDHAETAVLSPDEDARLKAARLAKKMIVDWWDAELAEKVHHRMGRYAHPQVAIVVEPWTQRGAVITT